MPQPPTRPSLLVRVADPSDDDAWREFDATYRDLILGYARSRGLQAADAEDVRQLVMMGLARALRGLEYRPERGRFRGYLGTVVRNAVNRQLKREVGRAVHLETELREIVGVDEDGVLDEVWEREWVQHHYRRAMERVRATFEERSVQMFERLVRGASVREVARDFGATEQAVHQVKQRIKTRMRELIEAQVGEEEGVDEPRP